MKENYEDIIQESILDILSGKSGLYNNNQMDDNIHKCKLIFIKTIMLLEDKEVSNFILTNDELFKLVNYMNDLLKELIKLNN